MQIKFVNKTGVTFFDGFTLQHGQEMIVDAHLLNENRFHIIPGHQHDYLSQINGSEPDYKSLHQGQCAIKYLNHQNNSQGSPPDYMNTNESDTGGIVKYYVLEDNTRN